MQISPVTATGASLCLATLAIIYGTFNARQIKTVHYDLQLKKQGRDMRLALVSDMHIGAIVGHKWVRDITDAINKAKPDIIIMAGDIFDNSIDAIKNPELMLSELKRMEADIGIFACPGNHDVDRASLEEKSSTERISSFLEKAGIKLLQDEAKLIADSFYVIGRKDTRPIGIGQKHERKTAGELTENLDKNKPIIFMDHQPIDFPKIEEAGADLILSGHTHKGQFFPANIATKRIFKKAGAVHYGLWKGKTAQGLVTSGAAVWGPVFRILSNSEVAILDIKFT
ncbi:MAG: metallophosphoesterase [Treponema sp.]|nr:metallophosphoesterase [Treponema sp.]